MNDINHTSFRNKFFEFMGRTFGVVSTIDHPYASPPIRLIDCHNNLKKINDAGMKPLILIWDVNFPNIISYRYELIFDTGIFSSRDENFFIFSPKIIYPLQKPIMIDFLALRERILLIMKRLQNSRKETESNKNKEFIENIDRLISIYKETILDSDNGTDFYQKLLKRMYVLMGFNDLSKFVADSFYPYFNSQITQKWIPYCIRETKDSPIGFLNLLNAGLFKKPYFRNTDIKKNQDDKLFDPIYIRQNIDKILEGIENKILIPSYEIFFWTLFLANIKHFGNDYDFFSRLDAFSQKHSNLQSKKIQLTKHNQDCQSIIMFEKDRSFNCLLKDNKYIIKKNNSIKNSRISNLPAIYCHLGNGVVGIIKNIFESKIEAPYIIKMGELNIA